MNKSAQIQRRQLLKHIGRAGLAAAGLSMIGPKRTYGRLARNEKIVVGLIGCGGMGNHHLGYLLKRSDVEVAAVCDVHIPRYVRSAERAGSKCQGYQDYRRLLDRKDIDAVWVATPDHWHALMAIHACQAAKDVYVEKPLTTTVHEGRKIVETARRYGRIVQVGTQQRSMEVFLKAIEIAHAQRLGPIVTTRTWIGPNGIGLYETPQDPPKDLDWNLWLGPAPWVPYSPQRLGAFRAFDDYAGGELTNWGPHLLDIALWAMKQDSPLSIQAHGGSYRQPSCQDHETIEIVYEFEGCTMTWSQSPHEKHAGKGYGTMFQGTAGRLIIDRRSFIVEPESLAIPEYIQPCDDYFLTVKNHHTNFLQCMRTRNLPNADCEIGHRATSACLLGNIAVDCRRRLVWDGKTEKFVNDKQADRHLYRPYRAPWHL